MGWKTAGGIWVCRIPSNSERGWKGISSDKFAGYLYIFGTIPWKFMPFFQCWILKQLLWSSISIVEIYWKRCMSIRAVKLFYKLLHIPLDRTRPFIKKATLTSQPLNKHSQIYHHWVLPLLQIHTHSYHDCVILWRRLAFAACKER